LVEAVHRARDLRQSHGCRFTFCLPAGLDGPAQILMPTASILGTHLCNAYEVARMNGMIAAGLLRK
jgi:acrylyl-CoA reductase (NADPH)/3-hydroxypropionyl-CoA dehydratase/3-hydroxypropionyl-CoA synthetase